MSMQAMRQKSRLLIDKVEVVSMFRKSVRIFLVNAKNNKEEKKGQFVFV